MDIKYVLKRNNVKYRIIEEEDYMLIKVNNSMHLVYITNKESSFKLTRDLFDYIDMNSIPYCLILHNTTLEKIFYLTFPSKNNWIKGSFNGCEKQWIHLGKQILNNEILLTESCK